MHRPSRVGLAPDRLPQRQRQVQRGRGAEEHGVASDRAGAVVEHDGQPRPRRRAGLVEDEQVEFGVVGLPDLVRPLGLAPVDQLVAVPQRHRPVVRQRQQLRVQGGHDRVDGAVGRDRPAVLEGRAARPAGDARDPGSGTLQRQALHQPHQLLGQPAATAVRTVSPGQARQAGRPVSGQPPLRRAQRHPAVAGRHRQGHVVLHDRAQHCPAPHHHRALPLVELGQLRGVHLATAARSPAPR
jgi:hypothetical protein